MLQPRHITICAEGDRRSSEGRVDVVIIQLSNDDKEDNDKEDDDIEEEKSVHVQ